MVRKKWPALHALLILRRDIREDLRGFLKGNNLVLKGADYKRKKLEKRQQKAVVIQSAYRRMLSYRAYERKKLIRATEVRRSAACRVQCLIRSWRARMLTGKLRERRRVEKRHEACTR
jgi:hypothetical protein